MPFGKSDSDSEDPLAHIERGPEPLISPVPPMFVRELTAAEIAAEEREKKAKLRREQLEMRDRVKREETRKAIERERRYQQKRRQQRAANRRKDEERGSVAPIGTVVRHRAVARRSGDSGAHFSRVLHSKASERTAPELRSQRQTQDVRYATSHSGVGDTESVGHSIERNDFHRRRGAHRIPYRKTSEYKVIWDSSMYKVTEFRRSLEATYKLERREICNNFNLTHSCDYGDYCRYRHVCQHCGSLEHGLTWNDGCSPFDAHTIWQSSMYRVTDERRRLEAQFKIDGREICLNFNRKHNCPKRDVCYYRHVCAHCGSLKHGKKWIDGCYPFDSHSRHRFDESEYEQRYDSQETGRSVLVPPRDFRRTLAVEKTCDRETQKESSTTVDRCDDTYDKSSGRTQKDFGQMERVYRDTLEFAEGTKVDAHSCEIARDSRVHSASGGYYAEADESKVPPKVIPKQREERSERMSDVRLVAMATESMYETTSALPLGDRHEAASIVSPPMALSSEIETGTFEIGDLSFLYCLNEIGVAPSSLQPADGRSTDSAQCKRKLKDARKKIKRERDKLQRAHQSGSEELERFQKGLKSLRKKARFLKAVLDSQCSEQMEVLRQRLLFVESLASESDGVKVARGLAAAKQLQRQTRRTAKQFGFEAMHCDAIAQSVAVSITAAFAPLRPKVKAVVFGEDCVLGFCYEVDGGCAVHSLEAVVVNETAAAFLRQSHACTRPIARISMDLSAFCPKPKTPLTLFLAAKNEFGQSDWARLSF